MKIDRAALVEVKASIAKLQDFYLMSFRTCLGLLRRPLYATEIIAQMDSAGMGSIAIVVLISAFLGMALSLQIIDQLSFVGMQMYTGQLIAYSIINEIGPVFIAIIFAGRVGGGSASELGSMGLNQQLDALRVYGVDPLKKLVAPRLVASIVILPALTVIGDLTALIGGAFMAVFINEQSPAVYWNQVGRVLTPRWIAPGVLKPMAFGSCIALVSCYKGLTVSGGALGLRRATTGAFVQSALLIIALDFVITKLVLMTLGRA